MKTPARVAYTQKEIAAALNSTVAQTLKPSTLKAEISDTRLRKLREYAQAAIAPMRDHVEQGLLSSEELVAILAIGSYFVHLNDVMETDKTVGEARKAKALMGDN